MGFPPRRNDHLRAKRGLTQGWTATATRSNRRFLWSVVCDDLGNGGLSFTLTVRNCPATAAVWAGLRRAFMMRLARMGAVRTHWLTEWQRRGVPHLHGCVWFPADCPVSVDTLRGLVVAHWVDVAGGFGALPISQDSKSISGALGWLQYLAKHADRGLRYYQRAAESIPDGWRGSTGRMWGHTGVWPLREPQKIVIDDAGGYAFRRICQRWRLAQSRVEPDLSKRSARIRSARRCLQSNKRGSASVRGSAEWLPLAASRQALLHLASSGYEFTWADDVEDSDTQVLPGFEE
jgi:hypothetical protein